MYWLEVKPVKKALLNAPTATELSALRSKFPPPAAFASAAFKPTALVPSAPNCDALKLCSTVVDKLPSAAVLSKGKLLNEPKPAVDISLAVRPWALVPNALTKVPNWLSAALFKLATAVVFKAAIPAEPMMLNLSLIHI